MPSLKNHTLQLGQGLSLCSHGARISDGYDFLTFATLSVNHQKCILFLEIFICTRKSICKYIKIEKK